MSGRDDVLNGGEWMQGGNPALSRINIMGREPTYQEAWIMTRSRTCVTALGLPTLNN